MAPDPGPVAMIVRFALAFARFSGPRRTGLALAAMLAGAGLEGVGLVLLVPMLSVTIGTGASATRLAELLGWVFHLFHLDRRTSRLIFLFAVFAAVMILRILVAAVRDVLLARQRIEFVEGRSSAVLRRLAGTRWEVVARMQQARVAHALNTDILQIKAAAHLLQQVAVALVLLAGQCAAALVLAPGLALICFVFLGAGALLLATTMRRAQRLGEQTGSANVALMDNIMQYFGGLKLAVSQDLQHPYIAEMEGVLHGIADRQMAHARFQARSQLLFGIAAGFIGLVICVVGLAVMHIHPATLVGLLVILVRMAGPAVTFRQAAQQLAQLVPHHASLDGLEAELAVSAEPHIGAPAHPGQRLTGAVSFSGVSFVHAGSERDAGLRDFSISLPEGQFLGVTGASGAGKTSFADLLVGLHRPQAGEVRVGGELLDGAALPAWRAQIGYVAQDPYLFHDSVRRNLLWADPQADEAALWEALERAGAAALVRGMPKGLDTALGERGTLLSGGERQRLAVARALIRKPRLLILDEATNAIDLPGERRLIGDLRAIDPRPTMVMIAHRPESLEQCDRVIVIEEGRLVSDKTGGGARR
ncbi:ABC transporter ATP-binding protein [Sphingomonas caeni]|uniref:ABC transporter ATP-binding protein n=1 Tax=Sphingomonas caeni TaxID=2984949 RepID=UPI002232876C|nr:ABC transporter ATP-binding protein [Sphingomonas caeni]